MSAVTIARHQLEVSVQKYFDCKRQISLGLESTTINLNKLISLRRGLELSIKDLNRTHTIWRCRSEESGIDTTLDEYSSSWLENEWIESFPLEDAAEEIIYTSSSQSTLSDAVATSEDGLYDAVLTLDDDSHDAVSALNDSSHEAVSTSNDGLHDAVSTSDDGSHDAVSTSDDGSHDAV